MSLEKDYLGVLLSSLSATGRYRKPAAIDAVVKAAIHGSQTAYDSIIHHWGSFNQTGVAVPELYHPAALVAQVSDKNSSFADQSVFESAFADLMMVENRNCVFWPTEDTYLDNLSEKIAHTAPRTFFANASNASLDQALADDVSASLIDEIVFFWGWNFLNPGASQNHRHLRQQFDPTYIGSGLRVLKELPSRAEANASFYRLSCNLLDVHPRDISDLPITFTEEHLKEIGQRVKLQERHFCIPMRILSICRDHLQTANSMIKNKFYYNERSEYPYKMNLQETDDDRIILTTSGKHFLGFAIAVITAIAQILDSASSDKTLHPAIDIENLDHGWVKNSNCVIESFEKERAATDWHIKNLLGAYPILVVYRDYFLNEAHYMEEPRFALVDDEIRSNF